MTDIRCLARRLPLLVLGLCLVLPAWPGDWVMPGLSAQWIARDMAINGVPASAINAIRSPAAIRATRAGTSRRSLCSCSERSLVSIPYSLNRRRL